LGEDAPVRRVLWLLALVVVGAGAWVRLAPSEPAVWHVDPVTDAAADGVVRTGMGDARVALVLPGTAEGVLSKLDAIALATPRTKRIAGSAAEGRITWVTRSALWGFPDYTTAAARVEAGGTRLDFLARLRFGGSDFGVNAARLTDWVGRLHG
jgi:Protein of unknown function (DUF1499)